MAIMTSNNQDPEKDFEDSSSENDVQKKVSLRQRLEKFTWAWFTSTMGTGGVALLLGVTPHQFRGLNTIGVIVYIFDLVLFSALCTTMMCRFILCKGSFIRSFTSPHESLFVSTFGLSLSTIISCMQHYGVPHTGYWLVVVVRILFWIYAACTFLLAIVQYQILFTGKPLTMQNMTPAWLLPIFPAMIAGTIASAIAAGQPPKQAIPIIICGVTFQGLGMLVAVFGYANWMGRLFLYGLPPPSVRPAMFIAVGPPSFTALALIGMADAAKIVMPDHYVAGTTSVLTADVLKIMAVFTGVFLWSVSFWFICLGAVAVLSKVREMSFQLSWWSFVFPNTGFIIATIQIGHGLGSPAILWVGSVLTVIQVAMWLFVGTCHTWALLKGDLL
ncbi:hypothetical protein L228DRAFT_249959 [Xylona heveae TC161]|uniref:C4-dicarboxylate transporter/malic acid transport protein n=1 Tax=Xylona heveae (strain CBS 132557 / TC161) TaxID=1328760 RepID=A0A165ADA4_XYLHT|nr:hypothetical protein L228DRAFT_249959 [Xylona heveae TC161]KZF20288.1 hypothetical protein L228DRAFT_249959 [Xylona heveae TC161]